MLKVLQNSVSKNLKLENTKVVITSGDKYVTAKKAKTTIKIKK